MDKLRSSSTKPGRPKKDILDAVEKLEEQFTQGGKDDPRFYGLASTNGFKVQKRGMTVLQTDIEKVVADARELESMIVFQLASKRLASVLSLVEGVRSLKEDSKAFHEL